MKKKAVKKVQKKMPRKMRRRQLAPTPASRDIDANKLRRGINPFAPVFM